MISKISDNPSRLPRGVKLRADVECIPPKILLEDGEILFEEEDDDDRITPQQIPDDKEITPDEKDGDDQIAPQEVPDDEDIQSEL